MSEGLVAEEYRSLSPLQTRILTHRRYTEGTKNDLDGDVIRALSLAPDAAVLDVGSGTGEFQRRLRAEGHTGRLCVVDASEAAVAAAEEVDGVDARLGDAQRLAFGEAEFDAVTARHMLYHVPDPVQAIRETRRVLKPGGRFAAVVNCVSPLPLMSAVVDGVLKAHGYPMASPSVDAGNLPGMVSEVFGECQTIAVDGALVFHEPDPIIAYSLSSLTLAGAPYECAERETIAREIDAEVRRRFAALDVVGGRVGGDGAEGNRVWRDPKGYVVCVGVR